MAGVRILKVSEEVYSILKAIKENNNAKSFSEAIKLLAEGKVEKITVSEPKTSEKSTQKISEDISQESLRKNVVEIKAMLAKALDLLENAAPKAQQRTENLNLDKCPYCGLNFRGNRMRIQLLNVHLPLPRVGIELIYQACPSCEKPLSEITWKPMEQG